VFYFCSDEETEFLILPENPIKNELFSSEEEVTEDDDNEVNDPDFINEEDSGDEAGPPAKQRKPESGRPRMYKTKEEWPLCIKVSDLIS